MELLIAKLIVLFSLSFGAILSGYFTLYVRASPRLMSYLTVFSGGVFLAGGCVHLLSDGYDGSEINAFPLSGFLMGVGFLFGFSMEEIALAIQARSAKKSASPNLNTDDLGDHKSKKTDDDDLRRSVDAATSVFAPRNSLVYSKSHQSLSIEGHGAHSYRKLSSSKAITVVNEDENELNEEHGDHGNDGHDHFGTGSADSVVIIIIFLALSMHSIMEGLVLGVSQHFPWGPFIAIVSHKFLAAISLGTNLVQNQVSPKRFWGFLLAFASMTPTGILIGLAIEETTPNERLTSGLTLFAAGLFIFVAGLHIIAPEFAKGDNRMKKLLCLIFGYGIMSSLGIWT